MSVRYHNIVADLLGLREEDRLVPAGATLRDLVTALALENGSFRNLALTSEGEVSGHLRLFRNGQAALDLGACLADGDEIRIFPAISGG